MVNTRAKSLWTENLRAGVRAFRSVASRDSPLAQSEDDAHHRVPACPCLLYSSSRCHENVRRARAEG